MEHKNWIDAMIQREAIPKVLREDTVEGFCKQWEVPESTYYYQATRKENQKEILKIALSLAKKGTPEVLEKLREKAESGDTKAIEMFLNYVLELSKNLDVKSDGKQLPQPILLHALQRNDSNEQDTETKQED